MLQELRSAVPVTQVKTLLNTVHGQLGRSGLLGAISSRKGGSIRPAGTIRTAGGHLQPERWALAGMVAAYLFLGSN